MYVDMLVKDSTRYKDYMFSMLMLVLYSLYDLKIKLIQTSPTCPSRMIKSNTWVVGHHIQQYLGDITLGGSIKWGQSRKKHTIPVGTGPFKQHLINIVCKKGSTNMSMMHGSIQSCDKFIFSLT